MTDALEAVACSLSAARGACEKDYAELYNTLFDASQELYKVHGIIMAVSFAVNDGLCARVAA